MSRVDVQTNIRLPADLKDRLVASADENHRSLSAEVSSRLQDSYGSSHNMEDMLHLVMRLERDLYTAELETATMKVTVGFLGIKLRDLIHDVGAGKRVDQDRLDDLMVDAEMAVATGQEGHEASEPLIDKMREAVAKLAALPKKTSSRRS